ncbi:MAG: hypothetical protein QW416_03160 [Candidatus Nitrosocaldaceae archaeon]
MMYSLLYRYDIKVRRNSNTDDVKKDVGCKNLLNGRRELARANG